VILYDEESGIPALLILLFAADKRRSAQIFVELALLSMI
jgi:hypothetical protein